MKKMKFFASAIGIVLLSVYFYQNFIYYRIPFNPIKEYASETLVDFHITKNLPNDESVYARSHDLNTGNLILEYFSELKLIPLKDQDVLGEFSKIEDNTYLTGMLKFNHSNEILISNVYIDNPTVLYISSFIPGFKGEGYYKIVDSEFDYNYIYKLIGNTEK